jgi:hypothetical protein
LGRKQGRLILPEAEGQQVPPNDLTFDMAHLGSLLSHHCEHLNPLGEQVEKLKIE